jgi:hypothetical protein
LIITAFPQDHRHHPIVPADADGLPRFVSSEFGHRKTTRHFRGVLVLRGNGEAQYGNPYRDPHRHYAVAIHRCTS